MANLSVVILDPYTSQPLKGVTVEAHDISDGSFITTAITNDYGVAEFSLTADASFHARTVNTPPLYQIVFPVLPGMGPFEYDHLVDAQWAAKVSAGEGTEGQTFTTFHGQSFKVWSVIQSAIDDWVANTGEQSILVVPGNYAEDVSIQEHLSDVGSGNHRLLLTTPPGNLTQLTSLTVAGKFKSENPNYPSSRIENFRLTGDLNIGSSSDRDVSGMGFFNVNVAGDMVFQSDTSILVVDHLTFDHCVFGAVDTNSKQVTIDLCRFTSCSFNGRFRLSFRVGSALSRLGSTTFADCSFREGMQVGEILGVPTGVMFSNCYLRGSATEPCFNLTSTSQTAGPDIDNLSFAGCYFEYQDHDAEWAFIKVGIAGAIATSDFVNLAIAGCTFRVQNVAADDPPIHILWAPDSSDLIHASLVGNSFIADAAGGRLEDLATSARSYSVEGYFERSVFGPNVPADFEVNLQGGTKNLYVGTGEVIGGGIIKVGPSDRLNLLYDNGALSVGWTAFITREDNVINSISASTLNVADDDTSYIEVLGSTVSTNTTGYTMGSIPLGVVVASSGDIDSITEESAVLAHPQAQSIALPVIGTPTYKFVEDMNTLFHSAGQLDGGAISDSDNQQIDVAAGRGAIRIDTNSLAQLKFFDWAGVVNQDITVDTIRYVGVEYNNGSPQVAIRESENWNMTTDFPLGEVVREGSTLHITSVPWKVGDHARFMAERMHATNHIARDNHAGGLIFGETGARFITVTSGTFWVGLTSFAISSINTNNGDDFDTYSSKAASDGLEAAGVSQWPNGQYDNGGTLANLGTNKWANLWWYLELDGGLVMVYGTAQYATQAQAEAETPPTTIPNRLDSHGTLSSRFIFQEGAATAAQILSPFTTMFVMSGVTSHGDLADIGGGEDDHDEYLLADGSRALTGKWVATPSTAQDITAAGDTILANAAIIELTADSDYTLTSTPTIAAGSDGQQLTIINVDGTDTITVQDAQVLAGSLLRLGATTRALAPNAILMLTYDSALGFWVERNFNTLVSVTPSIDSFTINGSNIHNIEIANVGTRDLTLAWTYTGVPSAGTVDVDDAGADPGTTWPATLGSPFTSLGPSAATRINDEPTVVGTVYTFTPTITVNGTPLSTPTATIGWLNTFYCGPHAEAANLDTSDVLELDGAGGSSALDSNEFHTFSSITADGADYLWIAIRSALSNPSWFSINSEIAAFTNDDAALAHTNDSGFQENYDTWVCDVQAPGAGLTVATLNSQPNNRIYIGPHTDAQIDSPGILELDDTADGESIVSGTVARTYTDIEIDAGEYLWLCHPDRVADINTIKDGTTGFAIDGSYLNNVEHTNQFGYVETYRCWRSTNSGIYPDGENVVVT